MGREGLRVCLRVNRVTESNNGKGRFEISIPHQQLPESGRVGSSGVCSAAVIGYESDPKKCQLYLLLLFDPPFPASQIVRAKYI